MRVLVTGASGFVGKHLIAHLSESGHDAVATSHRKPESSDASAPEQLDVTSKEQVVYVIDRHRPDAIVHLAAQSSPRSSWQDPKLTYEVNLLGTSNLLEALRELDGLRVLLIGSAQQYGRPASGELLDESSAQEPASPYALSKVAQELLGRMYRHSFGTDVVMARAFNHTGPGQSDEYVVASFCRKIRQVELGAPALLDVGRLDGIRDFLDVRDVVRAYVMLLEKGRTGEAYNVSSGRGVRIGDILNILLEASGLSDTVEVKEDTTPRPGDPPVLIGDNSKIRSEVGWEPEIPLQTSLIDTLEWYRGESST